ncbi:MAG: hypothetical protein DVB22_001871 [Verrucomicrobia bacterium]|nr:MAG: hypothetical protein DVB22_001871 [Verrucomicrobiota bacterium]
MKKSRDSETPEIDSNEDRDPNCSSTDQQISQPQSSHSTRNPSWWQLGPLLALPAVLGVVLLYFYGQQFPEPFAPKQELWGQFGDFVGGVLNPLIAWVSLIVIALNLRYTVRAILLSVDAVDAARKQAQIAQEHFTHEIDEQKARMAREIQAAREQRTFQLHQTWISPEMHALRTDVWEFLTTTVRNADQSEPVNCPGSASPSEPPSSPNEPPSEPTGQVGAKLVFIGGFRLSHDRSDRRLYYSVGSISHFIADVDAMLKAELLADKVFLHLLGRSLRQWCELYRRLDFRTDENDTSSASIEENSWHLKPLDNLENALSQQ